jgi:hypothetical protein
MKSKLQFAVVIVAFLASSWLLRTVNGDSLGGVAFVASLPATCTVGSIAVLTTTGVASTCTATNTWSGIGGTVTGGTCTNQVATAISGTGVPTCTTVTSAYVDSTIPSLTSTSTFTNKRITKRVVTASDATSITPNSDNADITYQLNTQGTGTLTINADAGTPTNGQSWVLKIKSTNVQTFSFNGIFVGGTLTLPTTTTGSGKIDYYSFLYDSVTPKWDFTGSAIGF